MVAESVAASETDRGLQRNRQQQETPKRRADVSSPSGPQAPGSRGQRSDCRPHGAPSSQSRGQAPRQSQSDARREEGPPGPGSSAAGAESVCPVRGRPRGTRVGAEKTRAASLRGLGGRAPSAQELTDRQRRLLLALPWASTGPAPQKTAGGPRIPRPPLSHKQQGGRSGGRAAVVGRKLCSEGQLPPRLRCWLLGPRRGDKYGAEKVTLRVSLCIP